MAPKLGISIYRDQNLIYSEGGQNTSTGKFEAIPTLCSQENAQKSQIWPVSLSQNAAKMRKINRRLPRSNQFSRWSGYISMSNFRPFKESTLSLMSPQRQLKKKVQLKKKIAKNTKLQFWANPVRMFIKQVDLLNHLEVSSQKIKSCCNNNSDEAMNQLLTFHITWTQDRVKVANSKKLQISNVGIFPETQCTTHLLKFVDKMCKYEMSEASTVEDTQRARFCPQTDRRTDEQGETSIHPFNFVERGYNKKKLWNG